MAAVCARNIYENGSLSRTTGGTLRPGGFELTERLLALCELPLHARVLDVGCGSGATVRYLLNASSIRPIGLDLSECLLQSHSVVARNETIPSFAKNDLSRAKRRKAIPAENSPPERAALVCASGYSLPIASGQMEAVLAECSLSAMASPSVIARNGLSRAKGRKAIPFDDTLAEFGRVLVPGGRLALSDIYVRNPEGLPALRSIPLDCGLRNALTKEDLLHRIEAQGFKPLFWEDHSDTLKTLAAQLIFSYGSLNAFWNQSLGCLISAPEAADPCDIQQAVRAARLGYYLFVAQKETPWKI